MAPGVLCYVRDLYGRSPEYRRLQPWEVQHVDGTPRSYSPIRFFGAISE